MLNRYCVVFCNCRQSFSRMYQGGVEIQGCAVSEEGCCSSPLDGVEPDATPRHSSSFGPVQAAHAVSLTHIYRAARAAHAESLIICTCFPGTGRLKYSAALFLVSCSVTDFQAITAAPEGTSIGGLFFLSLEVVRAMAVLEQPSLCT